MPQEKHPEVKITQDLLDEYASARSEWAKQAVEDNEFRNGKQWEEDQVKTLRSRRQEPIVVNVIHSAVEQAKAMLTSNKPRFQSTAREDSDVKTGKLFSDLLAYIWDASNGDVVLKQVIDDYYVKGMGCMMAYPDMMCDYGKGEIKLRAVDPIDLYLDPSSRDPFCRDSAHIIVGRKVMESQLLNQYSDYSDIIQSAQETSYLSQPSTTRFGLFDEQVSPKDRVSSQRGQLNDDRELEIMERYTKVKQMYFRVWDQYAPEERILNEEQLGEYQLEPYFYIQRPGEDKGEYVTNRNKVSDLYKVFEKFVTGDDYYVELHQAKNPQTGEVFPAKGLSKDNPNAVPGSDYKLTLGKKKDLLDYDILVLSEVEVTNIRCIVSVGDELLFDYVKPIEDYPIVTFMNGHNRNPFPISDVRLVKGLQQYINKIRSLVIAHASSSTNVKLLIPRGSMNKKQLEEDWAKAGTAVIEFDPELGQPIVAGPVPLPNELYKNEADAKADIERILGLYAMMQGDVGASPQTYKGTIAIDEFGQRRIKSKRDDIEGGLNQICKVVVQLIQWTYTDEKVIRLLNPNTEAKRVAINEPLYDEITGDFLGKLNDVTVGKYDVVVVSGSTLPSNRWARFEYYMELYKNGIIDQVEVLKQTNVADVEGVLNRASRESKLQSQIGGLQEQIKKLKGDLQTAQRESTHDKKRVEVKEFEVKLAKAEAKAEMAAQLFKARTNDELSKLKGHTKEMEQLEEKQLKEARRLIGFEE
tara:strand:+ start:2143 stop:4398 length:2256 start_codon:yes stop_codon:yes gene_type:complete